MSDPAPTTVIGLNPFEPGFYDDPYAQYAAIREADAISQTALGPWLITRWADVHTLLRLPTGIFYAQGVKANVVFFDAKPKNGQIHTKGVWFYDLRTNKHFTLKTRTLKLDDLQDFITCYRPKNRFERVATERFRFFSYDDLMARDKASLDIFWLKDDSLDKLDDLPPPDVLQQEIIEHLEAALASFRDVAAGLRSQ